MKQAMENHRYVIPQPCHFCRSWRLLFLHEMAIEHEKLGLEHISLLSPLLGLNRKTPLGSSDEDLQEQTENLPKCKRNELLFLISIYPFLRDTSRKVMPMDTCYLLFSESSFYWQPLGKAKLIIHHHFFSLAVFFLYGESWCAFC